MKEYAKVIVFLAVIATGLVPTVAWYINPEYTQMQIFLNTWLFIVYSIAIYIIGTVVIDIYWGNE